MKICILAGDSTHFRADSSKGPGFVNTPASNSLSSFLHFKVLFCNHPQLEKTPQIHMVYLVKYGETVKHGSIGCYPMKLPHKSTHLGARIPFFGFHRGYSRVKLQNMLFYHNEVFISSGFGFDATNSSVPLSSSLMTYILRMFSSQ